ncbi:MAG TPA: flagellar biosynthetic protein FliR [Bacillales bacterium]|nr:flagellar biosynthetic protein FliR [Bacillales bacterium]
MNDQAVLQSLPAFFLIFIRVASFFVMVPIFSYRNIPNSVKIGLAFFLSWIMFFTLQPDPISIDGMFFLLIIKETFVGLAIGMIAMILIYAVQVAGTFIDVKMGFAIASIINPVTGQRSPLIGNYLYMFAILLLLAVNAHYMLLDGIYYSYQFIPLETLNIHFDSGSLAELATKSFVKMFVIAFQMAVPVVGCLFLVDIALGIVARAVPQVNVFFVGMPVQIMVSFIVLFIVMPLFMDLVYQLAGNIQTAMRDLMVIIGGGG